MALAAGRWARRAPTGHAAATSDSRHKTNPCVPTAVRRPGRAAARIASALAALGAVVGLARPGVAAPHRALFVGNSYTYGNAPASFPDRYRALREALSGGKVVAEGVTKGGWTFAKHASDAKTQGEPLQAALLESWDAIFLQGQSQLPGFYGVPNGPFPAEQKGFVALAALSAAASPRLLLLLTWGRRDGDKSNPALFGTFTEMQDRLDAGTAALAEAAVAAGAQVSIVPVGAAFRVLHDLDASPGSRFASLYDGDGSHPSPLGSHLMALCAIAAEADVDPRKLAAPTGLDPAAVADVAEAAASACYSPADGGAADAGSAEPAAGDSATGEDAADPDAGGGDSGKVDLDGAQGDLEGDGKGADGEGGAEDGTQGARSVDVGPKPAPGPAPAVAKAGGCQSTRAMQANAPGNAPLALILVLWLALQRARGPGRARPT